MISLLAVLWGLTLKQFIIYVIAAAGAIAVAYVVIVKVLKYNPPDWFREICWIVLACFVAIVAVLIIYSMVQRI
jgi:uncharacterized protein (DUF983 family)